MTSATTEWVGELHPDFSSPGAVALDGAAARRAIESAEIYWLSTVRPDGRPHVTPLIAIWVDDALVFCTGRTERKRLNLESNSSCVLTTGCNRLGEGVDVVVEGAATRVADDARLQRLADAYVEKYGRDWRYIVRDGAFYHAPESLRGEDIGDDPPEVWVFEVRPTKVLAFGRDGGFSQTRWRFAV